MLGFYFKTIIFWAIVIFCSLAVCAQKIKENGWCDNRSQVYPPQKALILICCVCAIPFLRLLVVVVIYIMAGMIPNECDEWLNK